MVVILSLCNEDGVCVYGFGRKGHNIGFELFIVIFFLNWHYYYLYGNNLNIDYLNVLILFDVVILWLVSYGDNNVISPYS